MVKLTAVFERARIRRMLLLSGIVLGLLAPASATATITSVFGGSVKCETKTSGAEAGQRWCGNTANTTVASWDGTPIDVSVGFPVASGSDKNYPAIGIYHGYAGSKITPSNVLSQRWIKLGYVVFSMTDRGWGNSCGKPSSPPNTIKPAPCEHGYTHLMSRAYEVHDAQYLLGLLADEGLINPEAIGSTGVSFGGGLSLQIGSLNDRVELTDHELIPWTSPKGKPMRIAATAPEYGWTDLLQAEWPNGSSLDYVANSPYAGVLGNHPFGMEKEFWQGQQYTVTASNGYIGPNSDIEADLTGFHEVSITGGPFEGNEVIEQQEKQMQYHGAYYTSLSEPPSPALIENGWNDDLFPVDESVRYYNKVRATYPNQPIKLFYLDLGHQPRSGLGKAENAAAFEAAQNAWFSYYLKGEGAEPAEIHGGVTVITSGCPKPITNGTEYKAANWASLAKGEIHFSNAPEQTIQAPGTPPASPLESESVTVCTTQSSTANASAATYKLPAAPASGFTVMGATTVIGEFAVPGRNDQFVARLYDENVSTGTEELIGRQPYRPINPESGFTKQIFQIHPQAWKVEAGHVLKLELLAQDAPYIRSSSTPQSLQVRNLEIRVPTLDAPGSAGGTVQAPLPKYLPTGYTLARNVVPAAPSAPHLSQGSSPSANGRLTLAWEATQAATAPSYTLQHKHTGGGWSTVASSLTSPEYSFTTSAESEGTWVYRVTESNESAESEPSPESSPVLVDETAPNAPTASPSRAPDYAGGGGWYKNSAEVSFASNGDPNLADGSPGSGVNEAALSAPQTFSTSGSHTACGTVKDNAGNESQPGCVTVKVDATPPALEISCPATATVGSTADATFTASDEYAGLASSASGTVAINTSKPGAATASTTAVSNVGLETTRSCTTRITYTAPGAPTVPAGTSPSASGAFTLSWSGPDPMLEVGLSYTLQHRNAASREWSTVATGIEALSYEFTAGEGEGTWEYRVQAVDPASEFTSEWSPASERVVVDETAPYAPTAVPSRAPDYAGAGGWYKDEVGVGFTPNGDPTLSDGSPGSGVNLLSLSSPQTFKSSGAHTACGTVADNAENVSTEGCVTVQVDATPPSLEVICPASVELGQAGAEAAYVASDDYSGLATQASGSVAIDTSHLGEQTVSSTAVSNVGLETTRSCTTTVVPRSQSISFLNPGTRTYGEGDFAPGASASSGLPVTYTASGACSITGTGLVDLAGAGTCTVTAYQAGNETWAEATPVQQSFTVGKASQSITFPGPASHTYGEEPFTPVATSTSGLTVAFEASGDCKLEEGHVVITQAGSCTLTASQPGNSNYNPATVVTRTFPVERAEQSIDFSVAGHTYGDSDFEISGTATSGEPVSFTRASGECTVSANTVHITGAGSCTVDANQAGNTNYKPAPQVQDTFNIDQKTQSITFPPIPDKTYGEADFPAGATASSGLAVSYSAIGQCTLTGAGGVHLTGAGSCTITASQSGNANYAPASQLERSFSIQEAGQTVTFNQPPSSSYGAAPFTIAASSSSGLPITFTGSGACTVSPAGLVTVTAAGSCEVTALQAGNGQYQPATPVARTITITGMETKTALTPAKKTTKDGKTIKFKATVTAAKSGYQPTTGTVSFYVNGKLQDTQVLNSNGLETYSYYVTLKVSNSTYPVIAAFTSSDPDYASSTSPTSTIKVKA